MTNQNTQLFIELYNYAPAWLNLSEVNRRAFVAVVENAVAEMEAAGVKVVGFGFNDLSTDRRAPYDFFCVYTMPNADFARTFEQQVAASGWYEYFDQVNASGPAQSVATALAANIAQAEPSARA